jgi:hypothetical protein
MNLSVTIDPSIFAPPFEAKDTAPIEKYVSTLLDWSRCRETGLIGTCVCRAAAAELIAGNLYPIRPQLRKLLEDTNCVQFDANTVATLAEGLLNRSEVLESQTLITDLLAEEIRMHPPVADGVPSSMKGLFERCALIIAIVRSISKSGADSHHAIAVRDNGGCSLVEMRARLLIVENTRPDIAALGKLPLEFTGSCLISKSLDDYIGTLNESRLWMDSKSNADLAATIRVALWKLFRSEGRNISLGRVPNFSLHSGFFDSAKIYGALNNEGMARATLRTILETIDRRQMGDTHALRQGSGGEDAQVLRGRDSAWRRDIGYEFHLLYWSCHGAFPEIACVVPHNDNNIPH